MNHKSLGPVEPRGANDSVAAQMRRLLSALLRSKARGRIGIISFALLAIVSANAIFQIRLNIWQGDFYDAIARREFDEFFSQTLVFLGLVSVLLTLVVSQTWAMEILKVRLREWLTSDLLDHWLGPSHAYRLGLLSEIGSHPDQRVHEDTRKLTELTSELGTGLVQSSLLLISFVGVLWVLSENISFEVGGKSFAVPGYLVWCALGYSIGGSLLAWAVGRPLVRMNDVLYGREAELRFAMVRVGEAAEGIALYRGEADERARLTKILASVVDAMVRRAGGLAQVTWVTSGYGWLAIIVPVLVAAPGYFTGQLSFGTLMMIVGAFYQVQQALRWFVDNVPRIADWRATLLRVMAMKDALEEISSIDALAKGQSRILVTPGDKPQLELRDLSVALRDGEARIAEGDVSVTQGEHLQVVGGPNTGKSTLFRALAGIWPWGAGEIRLPEPDGMLFLPNRPYLPPGTLRETVVYPASREAIDDTQIEEALALVGLAHLNSELDRAARWDRELSLDEQQRLAFARVILYRPAWLFIDDAASALHQSERRDLFGLLMRQLGGMTMIAFTRDSEDGYGFERVVHMTRTTA